MNIRKLGTLVALTGLAMTPFAAPANGPATAADACIQAFVQTYLPKDRAVRVLKPWTAPGPLDVHVRRYTLELQARPTNGGDELVSARCTARADGRVIELTSTSRPAALIEVAERQ